MHTESPLILQGIKVPEGILLEKPFFILSPEPCCSFTALPFWAKVSGKIINRTEEEKILRITVQLLDREDTPLSTISDTMILDGKAEGFFETKIKDFKDRVSAYTITVDEISADELLECSHLSG